MKNRFSNTRFIPVLLIIILLLSTACSANNDNSNSSSDLPPVQGDSIEAVDYSDSSNWAKLPDSDSEVDVFFLYPTTYDGSDGKLAEISNEVMREGADEFIENKASAFETAGDIYAPYYRQVDATWFLTLPEEEQGQYLKGTPLTDVYAAFDFYIKNYNEGKPFILAGHSQGSSMTKALMESYFKDNPEVKERMVAAYVIGYYVTEEEIDENDWEFASEEDDTGVVISYNTVSPDTDLSKLSVWHEGAISINPISWSLSPSKASEKDNLGSYVDVNGKYEKVDSLADATVDVENGVVICDSLSDGQRELYSIPEEMEAIFSNGSYHGNDISFYYYNLRENAEKRVKAFLSK